MITSSYSDNHLSSHGRDRCDFVPRSQSLNTVPNYVDEYSEDDALPEVQKGAARSREVPKRKAATKATTSKTKVATSKSTAIKGRRRIKEENDVIDVDMYT